MKFTQKKIEETVLDIVSNEGLVLVKELKGKENISEFKLATKLKKDIKIIRHILYKLYNYNLVSSIRKKDKQKGWYVYYWTLVPENLKFLYLKNKRKQLEKLKEQIEKERNEQFFVCKNKCVRLDFNQATDFEFRCPECGELVNLDQDPNSINKIKKEVVEIEKEILSETKIVKKRISSKEKPRKTKKKITKKKTVIKKKSSVKSKKEKYNKTKKILKK